MVVTKWEITDGEKAAIAEEIGDVQLASPVTIYRRYEDTEPQWDLKFDLKRAIANLETKEKLDEEEIKPLTALQASGNGAECAKGSRR